MRRATLILISLIIMIVFIGCSPRPTPEELVNRFYSAIKTGDEELWQSILSKKSIALFEEIKKIPEASDEEKTIPKPDYLDWEINESKINDKTAVVKLQVFSSPEEEGNDVELKLVLENGKWKINITHLLEPRLNFLRAKYGK